MRWKFILGTVTGMIALLLVAIYFIVSSYDYNDLKPQITRAVKEATGRELKLAGNIGLKIGLNTALVAEDVSYQNAPWGSRPELAVIKKLEMQVALIPLISGKVELHRLVLVEPDILIETDKSGKLNLLSDAAVQTAKEPPPAEAGKKSVAASPFLTFREVRIEKGRLAFRDGRSARMYSLSVEKLTASSTSAETPIRLELNGALNGKSLEVTGTVGSVMALNEPHGIWPVKIECKAGKATLSVDGEIRDLFGDRNLAINIDARGPSVTDVVELAQMAWVPDMGPFRLVGKIVGRGGSPALESLVFDLGTEDRARLKLTGSIKDPLARRGMDLTFDLQGGDAARAGQLAGLQIPASGDFHISGHAVDSGEKAFQVSELKIVFAGTDLAGNADLNFAGETPRIGATLSGAKMDLRTFLPKDSGKKSPQEPASRRDRIFPANPISIEPLRVVDADLRLQAAEILTPRTTLNNTNLALTTAGGTLDVKSFKTNLGGGSLDARINVSPRGRMFALRMVLKGEGLDLARVTKELEASRKLSGHLDLDIDVVGTGGSVAELMGSLNGKTILRVSNSRIDNKYIDLLGGDISASAFRLLNPLSKKTDFAEVNCLVNGFDIKGGIAGTTGWVLDTNHITVFGEGSINLKTEALDILLKPSPKEGTGFEGLGKVSVSASELAKVLKLSGTLAKPSVTVDPTQSAIALGKSVGGAVLFGPAGIAASLAGGSSGKGGNPCALAMDAARKGVRPSDVSEKKNVMEKTSETGKKAVSGAGDKLKKFFGR
ncbi:MAG: AsmA family protein [Desulfobacteraceae bacterium]|nr:AsmA family protein [Desulfobacteraceae bacterium]